VWIALTVTLVTIVGLVIVYRTLGGGFDRWNSIGLQHLARIRTGWVIKLMLGINHGLTSRWTIRLVRLGSLAVLAGFRRWWHLLTFIGAALAAEAAAYQLSILVASPRPLGVRIIGAWDGFSFPSPPVAAVAVTPEREYMIVMEFIEGAREIGEAEVDDGVIDEGLRLIRRLFDAGLAHRDIKPANLMVREGKVYLIDAYFVQVRPSPWRQAVDLANMMLVLALRTDAERVYGRALGFFTERDISEAFAAARSVAIPTQLRAALKRDGRHLQDRFRAMAPAPGARPHPAVDPPPDRSWPRGVAGRLRDDIPADQELGALPVSSMGRSTLIRLVAIAVMAVVVPGCAERHYDQATCQGSFQTIRFLEAQAVPSAIFIPCVAEFPPGWSYGGSEVRSGLARFWLDSDRAGKHAAEVSLTRGCDLARARPFATQPSGVWRGYEQEISPAPFAANRYYVFDGGCISYRFRFRGGEPAALVSQIEQAPRFAPRSEFVEIERRTEHLTLCGALAPPCPG
jgi:tRNA A-37 threonylcarbamoyl transferase component Bud32